MHHIQKHVIDILASHSSAHYADIKPADMDGNQFTYHLKQLIADKLIAKDDNGLYSLTQKGKSYLITRYENPFTMAHTIFLIVIRHGDNILLRRRKVQPLLGYSGLLHGEPSSETDLVTSMKQRIELKTGIKDTSPKPKGSCLIKINKDGQTQSFSHAIIAEVLVADETIPITEDETGINYWCPIDKLSNEDKLITSTTDILARLGGGEFIWFNKNYTV